MAPSVGVAMAAILGCVWFLAGPPDVPADVVALPVPLVLLFLAAADRGRSGGPAVAQL
jgi:hypothetical protein